MNIVQDWTGWNILHPPPPPPPLAEDLNREGALAKLDGPNWDQIRSEANRRAKDLTDARSKHVLLVV